MTKYEDQLDEGFKIIRNLNGKDLKKMENMDAKQISKFIKVTIDQAQAVIDLLAEGE